MNPLSFGFFVFLGAVCAVGLTIWVKWRDRCLVNASGWSHCCHTEQRKEVAHGMAGCWKAREKPENFMRVYTYEVCCRCHKAFSAAPERHYHQ